jgi:hypothetical protein
MQRTVLLPKLRRVDPRHLVLFNPCTKFVFKSLVCRTRKDIQELSSYTGWNTLTDFFSHGNRSGWRISKGASGFAIGICGSFHPISHHLHTHHASLGFRRRQWYVTPIWIHLIHHGHAHKNLPWSFPVIFCTGLPPKYIYICACTLICIRFMSCRRALGLCLWTRRCTPSGLPHSKLAWVYIRMCACGKPSMCVCVCVCVCHTCT